MRDPQSRLDIPRLAVFLLAYAFVVAILIAPKGYFLAPTALAP